jgi:hypothetical protein
MWKWTLRIGGGLLALVVTLTIGLLIAYFVWVSEYKRIEKFVRGLKREVILPSIHIEASD